MSEAKPKARWWFYLVLFGLTAVVCLLVAEVAIRLTWAREYPRREPFYQFHPEIGLIHRPGAYRLPFLRCLADKSCEQITVPFTINQQGFRGPEFRNPAGRPLVAVIGDSQIEGQPVDDDKLLPAHLEKLLRANLPDAEVRNYSITSAGFVHYYATWHKFMAAQRPAVLVVLPIGVNDFRNCSNKLETFPPMRPYYSFAPDGTREVHFEQLATNYSRLHLFLSRQWDKLEVVRFLRWTATVRQVEEHAIRTEGGDEIIGDIRIYEEPFEPDYAEAATLGQEYLQRLIREATTAGTKVVVVALPWRDEVLDANWAQQLSVFSQSGRAAKLDRQRPENLIRATTQANGATFISFAGIVHKLPVARQESLWHVKNDMHITAAGHLLLAESIAPVIEQILTGTNQKAPTNK